MADLQRKTANLLPTDTITSNTYTTIIYAGSSNVIDTIQTLTAGTYTMSWDYRSNQTTGEGAQNQIRLYNGSTSLNFIINNGVSFTLTNEIISQVNRGYAYFGSSNTDGEMKNFMLVSGSEAKSYEPNGWVHSLRKLCSATEVVENPLYSDGTAITAYTIKGNTVQSGTPTPSNPITISGVGNKTANLCKVSQDNAITYSSNFNKYAIANNVITCTGNAYMGFIVKVNPNTAYTVQGDADELGIRMRVMEFSAKPVDFSTNLIQMSYDMYMSISKTGAITTTATTEYVLLAFYNDKPTNRIFDIMMSDGSTVPNYEPYGYKIPISSNQTALTPVYMTEQLMKIGDTVDSLASTGTVTYNIKKLVLTGEEEFSFAYSTAILPMTDYKAGNTIIYICTHYIAQEPITSATSLNADSFAFNPYANTRRLYIKDSVHNTLESFIQFLKDEYAAGTPVTVWYVLATATTESFTAPSIPTTDGANSITVDTTVQPSEFTATWTGWHDSSVKEYDGTDWQ